MLVRNALVAVTVTLCNYEQSRMEINHNVLHLIVIVTIFVVDSVTTFWAVALILLLMFQGPSFAPAHPPGASHALPILPLWQPNQSLYLLACLPIVSESRKRPSGPVNSSTRCEVYVQVFRAFVRLSVSLSFGNNVCPNNCLADTPDRHRDNTIYTSFSDVLVDVSLLMKTSSSQLLTVHSVIFFTAKTSTYTTI